jgi:hypothetical protein
MYPEKHISALHEYLFANGTPGGRCGKVCGIGPISVSNSYLIITITSYKIQIYLTLTYLSIFSTYYYHHYNYYMFPETGQLSQHND